MQVDSPATQWPQRHSLGDGFWDFLDVEVEAIMLFAWSHPELGDPATIGFWQRALEAEVWWKYFDCGQNQIWARRTSQQIYSLWLSVATHATWDILSERRKEWWLDAKQRAGMRHMGPSSLSALIQYHEYLVFRPSSNHIRAQTLNIETHLIPDTASYEQLESEAFPVLPNTYVNMIEARRNYVKSHVEELFQISVLQLRIEAQESVVNPLTLTPGPRIISSADAPIHMSCEDNSLRLSFGPHYSSPKSQPQLVTPSKKSPPFGDSSNGSSSSLSRSEQHTPTHGSSSSPSSHLVSSSLKLPTPSKSSFASQLLLSPSGSAASVNPSSSHDSQHSNLNSSFSGTIGSKQLKDWRQSEEFAEKAAQFNSFLQQLRIHPDQLHLLYCNTQLSSPVDFASFCQVYAMSSAQQ